MSVSPAAEFAERGWCLLGGVLSLDEVDMLAARLPGDPRMGAGTRNLLSAPWCADLAIRLRETLAAQHLADAQCVAVQCTLFDKSDACNWLVPWHQDGSIPAHGEGWTSAMKEGEPYVQPSVDVLATLLAVRLHLDGCGAEAGPLRVLSGSHRQGSLGDAQIAALRETATETTCIARAGDALVLSPLLLHASSRVQGPRRRRVLHVLFGPAALPDGLAWNRIAAAEPAHSNA